MVDGHDKEVATVDTMAGKVAISELADMVKANKATLQKHADAARELQKNQPTASR